jgi:hypothetical protein
MMELSMGFRVRYDSYNGRKINDLTKVLCNLTGTNYNTIGDVYSFKQGEQIVSNIWYDWGFFEIKAFKKGTMHLKFKNDKDWYLLNQAYGKLKGFTLKEK